MLIGQGYSKKKLKEKIKDRNAKIAEILGILEEKGKDKNWLIQEIRKHKIKVPVKALTNSFEILRRCPDRFVSNLYHVLIDDELEDVSDIRTLTRTFHWFFTDIVGSANPAVLTKDQARKVWALNQLIGRTETFKQWDPKLDVMTITGDGMVIGFSDSPEKPIRLAIELHKIISKYNESKSVKNRVYVRVGIDTGPVYFIKDLTGKENFWGPGIILARRVMDMARSMQILTSSRTAEDVRRLSHEHKSTLHDCGEYKIKHGEKLHVYNIYGDGWGNRNCPDGKFDEKNQQTRGNPGKFLFPRVDLNLAVTDSKTMMTHHTWLWNVVNVTSVETDQVSYLLDGDVPKDFENLNVSIKDEKNKKLKVMRLGINKPLQKQFIVKLPNPVKPQQKRRFLKLEYDWEEPERKYMYQLATDCNKFSFSLTVPKTLLIKPGIFKVDMATKERMYASPPPDIKYHKNATEIIWKASNLKAYESYEFQW
ncbi:MAG TPA: adenylate/guanylate cyclase domain-containing protein [Verrucomicrobiae bacterium]|nr:adenylate/guanylate cyclase domain-containing protein [Verrucomicrobiae bacterium]